MRASSHSAVERVGDVVVVADVRAVAAVLVPPEPPARAQRVAAVRDLADHARRRSPIARRALPVKSMSLRTYARASAPIAGAASAFSPRQRAGEDLDFGARTTAGRGRRRAAPASRAGCARRNGSR